MKHIRLSLLSFWLMLTCLAAPAAVAMEGGWIQSAEANRFALIVGDDPAHGTTRLAAVLRDRYGFTIEGGTLDRRGIDEAMERISRSIEKHDELVVFLALPMVRAKQSAFVPAAGSSEEPKTQLSFSSLASWLNALPTGAALVVFPACRSHSPYRDPILEDLAYSKRPGPLEVLLVCDLEASRWARPEGPGGGTLAWRAEPVAAQIANRLEAAADGDALASVGDEAVTSPGLVRALGGKLESIEADLITIPLGRESVFRFAPIATRNEYEARYATATDFDQLTLVIQDYLAATNEAEGLQEPFATFAGRVAADPRAQAVGADLQAKMALQLRSYAMDALDRMPSPAAREAFRHVATHATDSGYIRGLAVSTLGSSATSPADLMVLRGALNDPEWTVRESAARGIARAQDDVSADLLAMILPTEPELRVRIALLQGLASFQREADRAAFVGWTRNEHWGTRNEAVAALSRLRPAVDTNRILLRILANDDTAAVREAAAYALGKTTLPAQRAEIERGLINALTGAGPPGAAHEAVRAAAASSLGKLGGARAVTALRAAVANSEASVHLRNAAAESLGQLKSPTSIPELQVMLAEPEPELRRAAVSALGMIGTPEAAEIIFLTFLTEQDTEVAGEAKRWADRLELEHRTLGKGAQSSSLDQRLRSVDALAQHKDPTSLGTLIDSLGDRDAAVRRKAIDGLVKNTDSSSMDQLIEALDAGPLATQLGAIEVLGKTTLDHQRVIDALAHASSNSNSDIRNAAVEAFSYHRGTEGLAFLLKASNDPIDSVRKTAARALGTVDSPRARARLLEMAREDTSEWVKTVARQALSAASQDP